VETNAWLMMGMLKKSNASFGGKYVDIKTHRDFRKCLAHELLAKDEAEEEAKDDDGCQIVHIKDVYNTEEGKYWYYQWVCHEHSADEKQGLKNAIRSSYTCKCFGVLDPDTQELSWDNKSTHKGLCIGCVHKHFQ
jgi:hypothetical protein